MNCMKHRNKASKCNLDPEVQKAIHNFVANSVIYGKERAAEIMKEEVIRYKEKKDGKANEGN